MLSNAMKAVAIFAFGLLAACGTSETIVESNLEDLVVEEEIVDEDGKVDTLIYLTDRTGKKWEIGHAVVRYGFQPENFEFGLGPNAIPPILTPKMIEPGSPGYPDQNDSFLVLGTRIDEDARAYPLAVMVAHEIADDSFDGVHVAVAY